VKRSVHGIGGNYRIVQISDRGLGGQKPLNSVMGQFGFIAWACFLPLPVAHVVRCLAVLCELTFHYCVTGYLRRTDL
jgi:hypothetical protein